MKTFQWTVYYQLCVMICDLCNSIMIRSDAQRAAKQKERREQQLEKHSFNAEMIEDPSVAVNMVREPVRRYEEVNGSVLQFSTFT